MRLKSSAIVRRSRSLTPDQSLRFQTSRPTPSRTYGKHNLNRSHRNASSRRHLSPPVTSSLTPLSSTYDLTEPIVLRVMSLPSFESTPSTYGMTSNANTHTSSSPAHKVLQFLVTCACHLTATSSYVGQRGHVSGFRCRRRLGVYFHGEQTTTICATALSKT